MGNVYSQPSIELPKPDSMPMRVKPPSSINEGLSILVESISFLDDEITRLQDRIKPILSQGDSPESDVKANPVVSNSELGDAINNSVSRLKNQVERLRYTVDCVDL